MYSLDIINLVYQMYINKIKIKNISTYLNISVNTIYRWIKIYYNKKIIISRIEHRIKHINNNKKELIEKIINYVNKNNGCSLMDIKIYINNKVSISTIHRILKNNNISHKKIKNHLVFKSIDEIENIRKDFVKKININEINNNIYIDESSFCINDNKRYGYSLKGNKINITKHSKFRERYSLIMAVSNTDVLCYKIVKNGVKSAEYIDFIEKNINIFKNNNVYQDNARIHHTLKLKELINKNNLSFKYNPPYSPEFNPIEIIFSKMKTLYRKLKHNNIINEINDIIKKININDLNNCYNHTKNIIKNYI